MWQAALYIRLSREDGNDESYSVTNQRQRLLAYFEGIAAQESMELAGVYTDDGCTGTDSDREAFQRMLRDLDEGKLNCIIVKDLSRLSRNDWECKRYLQHLFVLKDVRFISLELPRLDSHLRPDEIYDLGVTMQSAYNENHCRETSVKVRGTFNAKRRAGEFIGAFAPYGYQKDPADKHKLLLDPEAAAVVRDIFHWFVREGLSKNGIVRRLNAMGILCPSAYKQQQGMKYSNPSLGPQPLWSGRGVTAILSNQVYLGHMVQGKQRVKSYKIHSRVEVPREEWFVKEHTHEAAVEAELFRQAQDLLRRDTRTAPQAEKLYPFSGFLRCADCGRAMCRRSSKQLIYYACRTYQTGSSCSRHSIRHDRLEGIVTAVLQQQVRLMDDLPGLIAELDAAPSARGKTLPLEQSLRRRQQSLARSAVLRSGLYTDWKNGDLSREEYHQLKQEFWEKEQQLQGDIARLEGELSAARQSSCSDPSYEDFRKEHRLGELNRGLVTALIREIRIEEGGGVELAFAFAALS